MIKVEAVVEPSQFQELWTAKETNRCELNSLRVVLEVSHGEVATTDILRAAACPDFS
jgi:hypothetical protein